MTLNSGTETLRAENARRKQAELVKIIHADFFCVDCGKVEHLAFLAGHADQLFRCSECNGALALDRTECHEVSAEDRTVEREFQPFLKKK